MEDKINDFMLIKIGNKYEVYDKRTKVYYQTTKERGMQMVKELNGELIELTKAK